MDYDLGVWVLCQQAAGARDFDADGGPLRLGTG